MKTHLRVISCFVVMAVACGGLCFSATVRAQGPAAPQPSETPYANKKENPSNALASPAPSVTPTPAPGK